VSRAAAVSPAGRRLDPALGLEISVATERVHVVAECVRVAAARADVAHAAVVA
jgi:hypothetical protein